MIQGICYESTWALSHAFTQLICWCNLKSISDFHLIRCILFTNLHEDQKLRKALLPWFPEELALLLLGKRKEIKERGIWKDNRILVDGYDQSNWHAWRNKSEWNLLLYAIYLCKHKRYLSSLKWSEESTFFLKVKQLFWILV